MMLAFLGLGTAYALILQLRGLLPGRFWSRFLLSATVGTALGLLPIVLWNVENDFVAYKHVAKLSTGQDVPFTIRVGPFFEMLGAQVGLLAPWWLFFIIAGGWASIKKSFFGPTGTFDQAYRQDLGATLFFWPLWVAITLWALKSKVEANWTAAAFVGAAILGGMALQKWWESPKRKMLGKTILATTAVAATLLIFASAHFPVSDSLNPTHRLKGWSDLGQEIDRLRRTEFENPEKVFFMSDKYNITSELAFYNPGQEFAYCCWTDTRRMNQYDLWPGPGKIREGWGAVIVRKRFQPGIPPEMAKMFDSISEPIFYQTSFKGKPARKFTLLICKGYNGYWPRVGFGTY